MKHKVSELEGALLDAAVAKAEGWERGVYDQLDDWARPDPSGMWWIERGKFLIRELDRWHPSESWAHAGPIIERERIEVSPMPGRWCATPPGPPADDGAGWHLHRHSYGDTPLIAAMRAYVASRFGDEVDLP